MSKDYLKVLRNKLLEPSESEKNQVDEFLSEILNVGERGDAKDGCFECGMLTEHRHHVVPRLYGGTKTIPLCVSCHGLAHSTKLSKSQLIILGIAQAKARGVKVGRKRGITDKQREDVIVLRRNGATYNQISDTLKLTKGTVCRVLKEQNEPT